MKKYIVCFLLVVVMCLFLSTVVFAIEPSKHESSLDERIESFVEAKIDAINAKITVDRVKTVVDFAGNEYKVAECSPAGYFIIHPKSGILVEYAIDARSPYEKVKSGVYGGPTYYYVKIGEEYVHTVLEETSLSTDHLEATIKHCNDIDDKLVSQSNDIAARYFVGDYTVTAKSIIRSGTDYWATNHAWLINRNSGFGFVADGHCGYIASNLLLKYWHYRGSISLPSPYRIINNTSLTNELISIGAILGYGNTTLPWQARNVINYFCSQESLPQAASWAVGVVGMENEIKVTKRPVILFGNLPNAGNHAVVAYGLNYYENPGNTYICHYGWNNGWSKVHVYGGYYGGNVKYRP